MFLFHFISSLTSLTFLDAKRANSFWVRPLFLISSINSFPGCCILYFSQIHKFYEPVNYNQKHIKCQVIKKYTIILCFYELVNL